MILATLPATQIPEVLNSANSGVLELVKNIIIYALTPAAIFYAIWKFSDLNTKVKLSLDEIKDLKIKSGKLLSHVDIIRTHLIETAGMKAALFAAGSPVMLLKKGFDLLKVSNFEKIYHENKNWFIEKFRSKNVTTLADIDDYATKLMEDMKTDERLTNFNDIAFENGTSLDVLLRVCAIYLRDEIAKEILK